MCHLLSQYFILYKDDVHAGKIQGNFFSPDLSGNLTMNGYLMYIFHCVILQQWNLN